MKRFKLKATKIALEIKRIEITI